MPAQFNHHYFLEIIHHFNKSQHYFGSNEFTSTKVVDMTQIKALLSQPAILIKNQNNWVAIYYPIIWNILNLNHYLDITVIIFTNNLTAAFALRFMYSIYEFAYFHFEFIKAYFKSCLKLDINHLNFITLHSCIIISSNEAVSFIIRVFHKIIYLAYWQFQISTY